MLQGGDFKTCPAVFIQQKLSRCFVADGFRKRAHPGQRMRCARERQHTNDDGHIAQQHFSGGSARYGCARLTHGAKGGWSTSPWAATATDPRTRPRTALRAGGRGEGDRGEVGSRQCLVSKREQSLVLEITEGPFGVRITFVVSI